MASEFSWTDRLSAFSSCLSCLPNIPCLSSSPEHGPIRLPNDDSERSLRGLLSDTSSSHHNTSDADALSLHSTVDSSGRRKPRSAGRARNVLRRQPKRVSVMGVALFGRPVRDDELSPNEDEHEHDHGLSAEGSDDAQPVQIDDALLARIANTRPGIDAQRFSRPSHSSHTRTHGHLSTSSGALSSRSTTYTDSEPLILHSPSGDPIDEEEALARAERRARRRERKALKQAALSLALAEDPRATFEGFQGSGSSHAAIPAGFRQSLASPLSETRSSESGITNGRSPQPALRLGAQHDEEDVADADADFGAHAYTTRRTDGSSADGRSSDTRSRTSASRSTGTGAQLVDEQVSNKPRRSKSGRSKKSSKHSSTTSSSAPLASPASAAFERDVQIASVLEDHEQQEQEQPWVRSTESDQISRFPSAGLGGGLRRKNSDAGALLATRGGF